MSAPRRQRSVGSPRNFAPDFGGRSPPGPPPLPFTIPSQTAAADFCGYLRQYLPRSAKGLWIVEVMPRFLELKALGVDASVEGRFMEIYGDSKPLDNPQRRKVLFDLYRLSPEDEKLPRKVAQGDKALRAARLSRAAAEEISKLEGEWLGHRQQLGRLDASSRRSFQDCLQGMAKVLEEQRSTPSLRQGLLQQHNPLGEAATPEQRRRHRLLQGSAIGRVSYPKN